MKNLNRLPNVGEMFGINTSCLKRVVLVNGYETKKEDKDDLYHYMVFSPTSIFPNSKYLMVVYLGNGYCQELYTKTYFNITVVNEHMESGREFNFLGYKNNESDIVTVSDLFQGYKRALKFPLVVEIKSSDDLYTIDDSFKFEFAKNANSESEISEIITSSMEKTREDLEKSMKMIESYDHSYAYTDYVIYEFTHPKKKVKKI